MSRKITQEEWNAIPFEELSNLRKRIRLLEEANYSCTQCGFDKRRDDGHHVVEIDHIDGNHKNNSRENLRVLCPNCHSLTHNFRNYGRKRHEKTGTRFRPANKGFKESQEIIRSQCEAHEKWFRETTLEAHASGEIDFTKFGWVAQLAHKLNETHTKTLKKKIQRLLPDFYVNHCFRSGKKRLIIT